MCVRVCVRAREWMCGCGWVTVPVWSKSPSPRISNQIAAHLSLSHSLSCTHTHTHKHALRRTLLPSLSSTPPSRSPPIHPALTQRGGAPLAPPARPRGAPRPRPSPSFCARHGNRKPSEPLNGCGSRPIDLHRGPQRLFLHGLRTIVRATVGRRSILLFEESRCPSSSMATAPSPSIPAERATRGRPRGLRTIERAMVRCGPHGPSRSPAPCPG